ncbi:MAG: exo-alpha-sialidase [Candidatus Moranbacteria bacterium]|nr:exo-alpha-sialidase [Candidatus Moranbacteria bacterium]
MMSKTRRLIEIYGAFAVLVGVLVPPVCSAVEWSEVQPAGDTDKNWADVAISANGQYMGGCAYGSEFYLSDDYGATWDPVSPAGSSANYRVVSISNTGQYMLVGIRYGRIYLSDDYGATWSEVQPAGDVNRGWSLATISGNGQYIIVGDGSYQRLYLSDDYGATWSEVQPAGNDTCQWMDAAINLTGQYMLAATRYSPKGLYLSDDYGATWELLNSEEAWGRTAVNDSGQYMLASIGENDYGRIYLSDDYGATWSEVQPAGDVSKRWNIGAITYNGKIMIAGNDDGRLYLSDDYGATWSEVQPAGDVNKNWWLGEIASYGGYILVGISSLGRLYVGEGISPEISGEYPILDMEIPETGAITIVDVDDVDIIGEITIPSSNTNYWDYLEVSFKKQGEFLPARVVDIELGGLSAGESLEFNATTTLEVSQGGGNWWSVHYKAIGNKGCSSIYGNCSVDYNFLTLGWTWVSDSGGEPPEKSSYFPATKPDLPELEDCEIYSGIDKVVCELKNFVVGAFMPTDGAINQISGTLSSLGGKFPMNYAGAVKDSFENISAGVDDDGGIDFEILGQEGSVDVSFFNQDLGDGYSLGDVIKLVLTFLVLVAFFLWGVGYMHRIFA